jgi:integrase
MQNEREKIDGVVLIPEPTEEYLNQRQLEDYRAYRADMIKWLLNLGKNPDKVEGYAVDTVKQRAYQIDQFYRWIWEQGDGYTLKATTDLADKYSKELAYEDHSRTHKAQAQKSIKTLFKYLNHERGEDIDWEPEVKFNNGGKTHQVRDYLSSEERRKIKQANLAWSWKTLLQKFAPEDFQMKGATESELKQMMAEVNRSDYAESTKVKFKTAVKKFYRIQNGGREQPDKTRFFTVGKESSSIEREDLFTEDELKRLFRSFSNVRDRAFTMMLYESAARPGELLSRNIGDFTSNKKGDFIYLKGSKGTPDRTNQLVRSGRTVREWLMQHPLGGEMGDIDDTSAPLWVKTEQQECEQCGEIPRNHGDSHPYDKNIRDRVNYGSYYRRFKKACEKASIPENKTRPYNLRHTRLTEVATFMGYEQLNKFAGWKPGSDRAKVYVHLNNDDVNQAIRDEYGLENDEGKDQSTNCPFCGTENQSGHSECRNCGRPLSLKDKTKTEEKQRVIERLADLEEKGVLEKLEDLEEMQSSAHP